eukprot:s5038_g1.t1
MAVWLCSEPRKTARLLPAKETVRRVHLVSALQAVQTFCMWAAYVGGLPSLGLPLTGSLHLTRETVESNRTMSHQDYAHILDLCMVRSLERTQQCEFVAMEAADMVLLSPVPEAAVRSSELTQQCEFVAMEAADMVLLSPVPEAAAEELALMAADMVLLSPVPEAAAEELALMGIMLKDDQSVRLPAHSVFVGTEHVVCDKMAVTTCASSAAWEKISLSNGRYQVLVRAMNDIVVRKSGNCRTHAGLLRHLNVHYRT